MTNKIVADLTTKIISSTFQYRNSFKSFDIININIFDDRNYIFNIPIQKFFQIIRCDQYKYTNTNYNRSDQCKFINQQQMKWSINLLLIWRPKPNVILQWHNSSNYWRIDFCLSWLWTESFWIIVLRLIMIREQVGISLLFMCQ